MGRLLQLFPGGSFWEQRRKYPCYPHGVHVSLWIKCYVASLLPVSTWLPCARVLRGPLICKLTSFALFSGLAVFPASLFSVYVIRCNLGLLCYWILPPCFASVTHSAALVPHVCASPKLLVSLSPSLAVLRSTPFKKKKKNQPLKIVRSGYCFSRWHSKHFIRSRKFGLMLAAGLIFFFLFLAGCGLSFLSPSFSAVLGWPWHTAGIPVPIFHSTVSVGWTGSSQMCSTGNFLTSAFFIRSSKSLLIPTLC